MPEYIIETNEQTGIDCRIDK